MGGNPLSSVDPFGLMGASSILSLEPVWTLGDPLSQDFVDGATGFGDGIFSAATFGQFSLANIRNQSIYTAGAIDSCSKFYKNAFSLGQLCGAVTATAGVGGLAVRVAGAATSAQAAYLGLQLATGAVDLSEYTVAGAKYAAQLSALTYIAQDAANDAGLEKYLMLK